MGSFVVNFHVKSQNTDQLQAACEKLKLKDFRIAGPRGSWATLYEEQSSSQDDKIINRLAAGISSSLKAPCIAFLIHDSDIACYWLYDQGKLLDEYNSMPDYFDEGISASERKRVQGKPEVFLRYCKPGVNLDQVTEVLQSEPTFADDTVSQLADMLGIDEELALSTYGDEMDEGFGGDDDFENDDDDSDRPVSLRFPQANVESMTENLTERMKKHFDKMAGNAASTTTTDSDAMVQAAAQGNVDEVKKLLQQGTAVNAPGKLSPQSFKELSSGTGLPLSPIWSLPLPPLMVAASLGKAEVVMTLIEHSADIQYVHPALGSALHLAVQGGWPEVVNVLLQAGVFPQVRNAQGQTPLEFLKLILQQLLSMKAMLKQMPGMLKSAQKLMGPQMPEEGWAACEKLLQQAQK